MDGGQRKGGRILIVEDDREMRQILGVVLEGEGYQVVTARNGIEALKILASGPLPALILLDLVMPGVDGWEFRACQAADPAFASIPIVAITGVACPVEDLLHLRAVEYLTKPFAVEWLLDIVARYCRPTQSPIH